MTIGIYTWTVDRSAMGKVPLVYVGQSVNLEQRKAQYLSAFKTGKKGQNIRLVSAVRAYQNWLYTVVEVSTEDELTILERQYYHHYKQQEAEGRVEVANFIEPETTPTKTPEVADKARQSLLRRYQDPVVREKYRQGQLRRYQDPAVLEKHRQGQRRRFQDPAEVEKTRQGQLRRFQDPAEVEKTRRGQLRRFQDPAVLEKFRQGQARALGVVSLWSHPASGRAIWATQRGIHRYEGLSLSSVCRSRKRGTPNKGWTFVRDATPEERDLYLDSGLDVLMVNQ